VLATEYSGPTTAIDHNLYVRGDLAYYSNYTFGLRVVDVGNPRSHYPWRSRYRRALSRLPQPAMSHQRRLLLRLTSTNNQPQS